MTIHQDSRMVLANVIAWGSHPVFVLPLLIILAVRATPMSLSGMLWGLLAGGGSIVLPVLVVRQQGLALGLGPPRTERLRPLALGAVCSGATTLVLWYGHAPHPLLLVVAATCVLSVAGWVVTLRMKISLHMLVSAGGVPLAVAFWGPPAWGAGLLVALVGWARWQVRAHTLAELSAGVVLGFSLTALLVQQWS